MERGGVNKKLIFLAVFILLALTYLIFQLFSYGYFGQDIGTNATKGTNFSGQSQDYVNECSDGDDNDNDGLIDYPNDPNCRSRSDNDEGSQVFDNVCGNGEEESGEQCDDGNTNNGDGCSSDCQDEIAAAICGNGILEEGELCDSEFTPLNCQLFNDQFTLEGNVTCNSECNFDISMCRTIDTECHLVNAYWISTAVNNGQTARMKVEGIGCEGKDISFSVFKQGNKVYSSSSEILNGTAYKEWTVNLTGQINFEASLIENTSIKISGRNSLSIQAACGNRLVEQGEQCDDGNTNNGDGCSSTCETEHVILPICGDDIDNDNDGFTDEEDLGCYSFSGASSTYNPQLNEDFAGVNMNFLRQRYNIIGGDPHILRDGDDYYLYFTGGVNAGDVATDNFPVYHSTDLVRWEYLRDTFYSNYIDTDGKFKWDNTNQLADYRYEPLWGPEVFKWNDLYVLSFSAFQVPDSESDRSLGHLFATYGISTWLAFSNSPEGPFGPDPTLPGNAIQKRLHEPVPLRNYRWGFNEKPHTDPAWGCPTYPCSSSLRLDGQFFVDGEDTWLVYTWYNYNHNLDQYISMVKLDPADLTLTNQEEYGYYQLTDARENLADHLSGKEMTMCRFSNAPEGTTCVTEGPFLIKRGGKYILFYTGNAWDSDSYSLYYKAADSLPCLAYDADASCNIKHGIAFDGDNPDSEWTYGSGSLFIGPDGKWYHVLTARNKITTDRQIWIVEQEFNNDGTPKTRSPQANDLFNPQNNVNLSPAPVNFLQEFIEWIERFTYIINHQA